METSNADALLLRNLDEWTTAAEAANEGAWTSDIPLPKGPGRRRKLPEGMWPWPMDYPEFLEYQGLHIVRTREEAIVEVLDRYIARLIRLADDRVSSSLECHGVSPDDWKMRTREILCDGIGATILHPVTAEPLRLNIWRLTNEHVSMLKQFVSEYRIVVDRYKKYEESPLDCLEEDKGVVSAISRKKFFLHYPSLQCVGIGKPTPPGPKEWARLGAWGLIEPKPMADGSVSEEWWTPTFLAEDFLEDAICLPLEVLEFSGVHSGPVMDSGLYGCTHAADADPDWVQGLDPDVDWSRHGNCAPTSRCQGSSRLTVQHRPSGFFTQNTIASLR
jgi:hypothetical protein